MKAVGLCQCGCGEATKLAPKTDRRSGWIKGQPLRYLKGHQTKGKVYPKKRIDPGSKKACSKCHEVQPIEQFGLRKDKCDGRESWCRSCQRILVRAYSLQKKFGITIEEYESMCESQAFRCAICQKECRNQRGNRKDVLAVDHCHKTGKIRGLLCMTCNTGLGHFEDDTDTLTRAITYIRDNRDGSY